MSLRASLPMMSANPHRWDTLHEVFFIRMHEATMKTTIYCACLASTLAANSAFAGSFNFASNANSLTGLASSTLIQPDIQLSIAVASPGAVIDDSDSDGLGIDSSAITGVIDDKDSKLNVLKGAAAGQGESLTFSFDKHGLLDQLRFDGLKDEPLEYFSLTLPTGQVLTLFDFEVEMRLNHQGFVLADLAVPNPTMADGPNDDFSNLAIPFAPGDIFTLTYGEIDYDGTVLPGYYPADNNLNPTGDLPNGSRFQGLTATPIPEPTTLTITTLALTACITKRRRA